MKKGAGLRVAVTMLLIRNIFSSGSQAAARTGDGGCSPYTRGLRAVRVPDALAANLLGGEPTDGMCSQDLLPLHPGRLAEKGAAHAAPLCSCRSRGDRPLRPAGHHHRELPRRASGNQRSATADGGASWATRERRRRSAMTAKRRPLPPPFAPGKHVCPSRPEAILRKLPRLLGLGGAPRRSRTPNLQIRSLSLYPVELWVHEVQLRAEEEF